MVLIDVGMLGLIYYGIGDRTVTPGVLGSDIALDVSTCRIVPWFILAVAWSHSVWVVVICLSMLGLMLVWVG